MGRDSDLLSLRRLGVERDTPGDRLVGNLRTRSVLAHRFVRELKLVPTRILGPRRSNRLRHWLIAHGFGGLLRMRVLKGAVLGFIVAIVLAVAAAAVWARFIEPDLIRVDDLEVDLPGLAPGLETLRVAFIADLHIEREGRREARLVRELNALDLDLLLVGGDFVQNAYWMSDYLGYVDAACRVLRSVRVRHGTYAVFGNNDEPEAMATRLTAAGIRMLDNRWERLELPGGALTLLGVGDPVTGLVDWNETFRAVPPAPILAIAHSPDAFAEATRRGLPWLLTGHTHGGQVLHPFIGLDPERFLRLLPGTPSYRAGLYREGSSALYVNRGIGMTHIPLRFACSPEITRIHLRAR
jgi:predicted MPP superfamily phosphohydrolase